jgi:RNA polymerase sigma factor (TIGR02999 family)
MNREALERLLPLVHDELHDLAARYLRAEGEHSTSTLQPTALVQEAYVRLLDQSAVDLKDRSQFVAVAALVMRHLLVEHAREAAVAVDDATGLGPDLDLVALDRALDELALLDEQQSQIVELRYFGGLGVDQVAETLGVEPGVVERDWAMARAWLRRRLSA